MEREGAEAWVGITSYAAEALGDVVFAELPEQGRQVGIFLFFAYHFGRQVGNLNISLAPLLQFYD